MDTDYPEESLESDELCFLRGSDAETFYVIDEGLLELSRSSRSGTKIVLDVCGPGEPIGLEAVLAGTEYSFTARALETSIVRRISAGAVQDLSDKNSSPWKEWLAYASFRRSELMGRCHSLLNTSLEERLKCQLCKLASKYGRRDQRGLMIDMELSRQKMSELMGSAVESVIRIVRRWETNDRVKTEESRLIIRDPESFFGRSGRDCKGCPLPRMAHILSGNWNANRLLEQSARAS